VANKERNEICIRRIKGGYRGCMPTAPYQPTKKRAVELIGLGMKVYEYMNEIGIKKEEYCISGMLCNNFYNYQINQLPAPRRELKGRE